jgi:hypothetical protein
MADDRVYNQREQGDRERVLYSIAQVAFETLNCIV